MLVREGQPLDLQEVRVAEQAVEVDGEAPSGHPGGQLGLEAGAEAPEAIAVLRRRPDHLAESRGFAALGGRRQFALRPGSPLQQEARDDLDRLQAPAAAGTRLTETCEEDTPHVVTDVATCNGGWQPAA